MWMAAFWDPVAGDYSANQDWFPVEDNGSVWEADLMRKAVVCFDKVVQKLPFLTVSDFHHVTTL